MGIKQIPSLQPTHWKAKPHLLPDDRTGKGSGSILRRESDDPFPDPYTDFPVADIHFYCREHTSGLWGLGITISISAGAGRRSKAIKGIDGGQSIWGRSGRTGTSTTRLLTTSNGDSGLRLAHMTLKSTGKKRLLLRLWSHLSIFRVNKTTVTALSGLRAWVRYSLGLDWDIWSPIMACCQRRNTWVLNINLVAFYESWTIQNKIGIGLSFVDEIFFSTFQLTFSMTVAWELYWIELLPTGLLKTTEELVPRREFKMVVPACWVDQKDTIFHCASQKERTEIQDPAMWMRLPFARLRDPVLLFLPGKHKINASYLKLKSQRARGRR